MLQPGPLLRSDDLPRVFFGKQAPKPLIFTVVAPHDILPRMNDKEGDNPSRDELLSQLLRTPPQPRLKRKRSRQRAEEEANRKSYSESSAEVQR